MNPHVRDLVQLQELEFVQSEQLELGDPESALEIGAEIERRLAELPGSLANLYRSLQERVGVAVVAERLGHCSACGLGIPTSRLSAIRRSSAFERCQGCKRILYHMADLPQPLPGTPIRTGFKGLSRYSSSESMLPKMRVETAEETIVGLIRPLAEQGWVSDRDDLLQRAMEREKQASTAVGYELAFPHVRGVNTQVLRFSFGTSETSVPFGASSAKIFCFAVIPTAANAVYLRLLSELVDVLKSEMRRQTLLECDTPKKLWSSWNKMMGKRIP